MNDDLVRQVTEEIIKSAEFQALKLAKQNLETTRYAKESLEAFYRDNDAACQQPQDVTDQDMIELKNRFELMMQNPVIAAYLKAGHHLECLITQFFKAVDRRIDEALK